MGEVGATWENWTFEWWSFARWPHDPDGRPATHSPHPRAAHGGAHT